MTIHSDHPFATPDPDKNPTRRLRGRLPLPVTIVATGEGRGRVGLTVSSLLVVEPDFVVFVVNDLADLADVIDLGTPLTYSVLEGRDEPLAEVFAGLAPAPGGMFTMGDWTDSGWGPRLVNRSWAAGHVVGVDVLGWSKLVTVKLENVELTDGEALTHVRGRYLR